LFFCNSNADQFRLSLRKFLVNFALGRAPFRITQPSDVAHPAIIQIKAPIGQPLQHVFINQLCNTVVAQIKMAGGSCGIRGTVRAMTAPSPWSIRY
jgi:hypothetical protein